MICNQKLSYQRRETLKKQGLVIAFQLMQTAAFPGTVQNVISGQGPWFYCCCYLHVVFCSSVPSTWLWFRKGKLWMFLRQEVAFNSVPRSVPTSVSNSFHFHCPPLGFSLPKRNCKALESCNMYPFHKISPEN